MNHHFRKSLGFTLLEVVVVIVITGVMGAMMAVFIKAPVQGYVDSSRRAEMTDAADIALRRLARDIRTSVPNSIRVLGCGGVPCVEYLPTRDGGRYRSNTPGNPLSFGVIDGVFDIVGVPIVFAAGDQIVVGSTQSDGNPPYDDTIIGIRRAYIGPLGVPQATVSMGAIVLPLWAEIAPQRFHVVDGAQGAVTYACVGAGIDGNGNGTGVLNRYAGYGYNVPQVPPLALPALPAPTVLANQLSACAITYNPVSQRNALLEVTLTIRRANEVVSLYQATHISNLP